MRDILILGTVIAVTYILLRIIVGSPLVSRILTGTAETFVNIRTECPADSKLYMYGGAAHCCSGVIDHGAANAPASCRPLNGRNSDLTFCTLGAAARDVPNCGSLRSGMMADKGAALCPPAMQNYVENQGAGKCCTNPGNATMTDCVDQSSCAVSTDSNEFKTVSSCQFLKAQQEAPACPSNYGPFTAAGQGAMSDIQLFGCTDNGQNCYAESTLQRLGELGYDVTGLTSCSKV